MFGSVFAIISTFQTELEWWIRVTGGLLGIVIASITICNMTCKGVRKFMEWFKRK